MLAKFLLMQNRKWCALTLEPAWNLSEIQYYTFNISPLFTHDLILDQGYRYIQCLCDVGLMYWSDEITNACINLEREFRNYDNFVTDRSIS